MKSKNKKFVLVDSLIILVSTITIIFFNSYVGVTILSIYFIYKILNHRDFICAFVGNLAYHNKNIEKALNWYKSAATTSSASPKYITTYVYLELKCGNYENADKTIDTILERRKFNDADLFAVQMAKSLVEWKKGNINECVDILENIYDKDYKSTSLFETLGYMLLIKGDLDRSLAINTEAYAYNEESAVVAANLGETYYKLGDKEKAQDFLKPLIDKNISFADPYYYFALILNEKGEKEEAITLLNKALLLPDSILTNLTKNKISETLEQIQC